VKERSGAERSGEDRRGQDRRDEERRGSGPRRERREGGEIGERDRRGEEEARAGGACVVSHGSQVRSTCCARHRAQAGRQAGR